MSQYLIIFLIVAVFRGVVWVVQKAKESAKAREALMGRNLGNEIDAQVSAAPAVQPPAMPEGMGLPEQLIAGVKEVLAPQERPAKKAVARPKARPAARSPAPPIPAARVERRIGPPTTRADDVSRTTPAPSRSAPAASRAEAREVAATSAARDARRMLRDRAGLRHAVLAREILGPPRSLEA